MTAELYLLYILLGAVAGIIYSLRRILLLELKIENLDKKIARLLRRKR